MLFVTPSARQTPKPAASSSTSHGAALTFETLTGAESRVRVRPHEETLLRVIDGILRLTIAGEERLMGIGDEAIVPAGAPHRLTSACDQTRIVMGFRQAHGR
jgi:mannose-6-phosphate isomerase-like protein (cupin superfamily)